MMMRPERMISYSQNREDVLLDRVFRGQSSGFYIDLGAGDPIVDSVTKHFYAMGWSGINVEPGPEYFSRLQADRPGDINLRVAVSNFEGQAQLFSVPTYLVLSSLHLQCLESNADKLGGAEVRTTEVEVTTLKSICERYASKSIDFLKIDVEGAEKEVIEGADWERFRPKVLVVEATLPMSDVPSHEAWEPLLLHLDYRLAYFDGLNRYYVDAAYSHLLECFSTPPNLFDNYRLLEAVLLDEQVEILKQTVSRLEVRNRGLIEEAALQLRSISELEQSYRDVLAELEQLRGDRDAMRSRRADQISKRLGKLPRLFRSLLKNSTAHRSGTD